jgi:hypothetical protein
MKRLHAESCKWVVSSGKEKCSQEDGCKSLYILTPMYGGNLTFNYHNSFHLLSHLCRDLGIEFGATNLYNESLISRARNRMSDTYLKETSYTNGCFIDADIGFDPQDIITMLEMDEPILGVPCSKKSIRWDRIQTAIARRVIDWYNTQNRQADVNALAEQFKASGVAFNPADIPKIGGDFVLNFFPFENKTIHLDKPEPMKHVGTGLLMIKREVFQKFMKAYPDRWYEARYDAASNPGRIHDFFKVGINPESREYDSEDYWFIHDCIALGYKALLLPWVKTTHVGTYTFHGDMPAALASSGTIF